MPLLSTEWLSGPRLRLTYDSAADARATLLADVAAACQAAGATPAGPPEQVGRGGGWVVEVPCRGNVAPSAPAVQVLIGVGPVLNAQDYGARGDGATDDLPAILRAVAAAASLPDGGTVYLPPGVYRVAGAIQLKSGVCLHGAGMDLTTVKLADNAPGAPADIAAYNLSPVTVWGESDVRIAHLAVDGNKASNENPDNTGAGISSFRNGIYVKGVGSPPTTHAERVVIEHVRVVNSNCDGISLHGARDVVVRDCYSSDHGKGDSQGNVVLSSDYCSEVTIEGVEGWDCNHGGIEAWVNLDSNKVRIRGNRTDGIVVNTNVSGGGVAKYVDVVIEGNWVDARGLATGGPGILVNGAATGVSVRNNDVFAPPNNAGISVNNRGDRVAELARSGNCKRVQVCDNRVERIKTGAHGAIPAISLADTDGAVVADNLVHGNFGYGILLTSCTAVVLSGNNVHGVVGTAEYWAPWDGSREWPTLLPYGLAMGGSQDCVVSGNVFRGWNVGIAETLLDAGAHRPSGRNLFVGNHLGNCWESIASKQATAPYASTYANNFERLPLL